MCNKLLPFRWAVVDGMEALKAQQDAAPLWGMLAQGDVLGLPSTSSPVPSSLKAAR